MKILIFKERITDTRDYEEEEEAEKKKREQANGPIENVRKRQRTEKRQ